MSVTKVQDLAYVRLQAPDLDLAEAFLSDFGLVRAERTSTTLFMRGTDPAPFIEVIHLGEPRLLASGWYVKSTDDLAALTRLPDASGIEGVDEPGGGKRVRIEDPLGYGVEFIHGRSDLDAIPVTPTALNLGWDGLARKDIQRFPKRPSKVKRIAHMVLTASDVVGTVKWYRETLGLVRSEDIYQGEQNNIIGSFNRCDRGEAYVDHHVFFCRNGDRNGLNHVSFEVQDIDDLMLGHDQLTAKGYRHMWGVGRHYLGSQIFDYWCDPWGRVHEHWTDSDRLNVHGGEGLLSREAAYKSQWGPTAPREFHGWATP